MYVGYLEDARVGVFNKTWISIVKARTLSNRMPATVTKMGVVKGFGELDNVKKFHRRIMVSH